VGQVAAVAEGYGFDWAKLDRANPGGELTLRLVPDQPVHGRILDLDGKPVAGAKVSLVWGGVEAYPGRDLKGLLEEIRTKNSLVPPRKRWWGPLPGQPQGLATDIDGRFQVSGLGRERTVDFDVEAPGIAKSHLRVMTREGETFVGPGEEVNRGP